MILWETSVSKGLGQEALELSEIFISLIEMKQSIYLSPEELNKANDFILNENYSALSFLIFDVIFAHPSKCRNIKEEFLNTKMTDWIERTLKMMFVTTADDELIPSIDKFISHVLDSLDKGTITIESDFGS